MCNFSFSQELKTQNCDQKGCSDCHPLYPGIGKTEVSYKNGKLDGIQRLYYTDEKLWQEISYKNGKIEIGRAHV